MKKLLPSIFFLLTFVLFSPPVTQAAIDIDAIRARLLTQQNEILKKLATPSPKPSATPNPSPHPTSTPRPTATPRPTNTPKPTISPTPTPSSTTDSVKQYLLDQINAYRSSQGLAKIQMDPYTCNFAKTRAQEISTGFNHDGFRSRINNKTLPYPSYSYVTENIAQTSNYKNVVSLWINSPSHAANMRANTPYVCVEASGNYYAYEGWKP